MKFVKVLFIALLLTSAVVLSHAQGGGEDEEVDYEGLGEEAGGDGGGGGGGGDADYESNGPVKVATDDTLADLIKATPVVLVEFYAPWCGHCQQLKPEYEQAAQRIIDAKLNDKISLVALDATKNERSGNEYKIQGFPTLMVFKDGKVLKDYDGGRDAESIFSALEALVMPAVRLLKSSDEVDAFLKKSQVAVLGHFTVPDNESAKKAFAEVADKLRDTKSTTHVKFAELADPSLAGKYKATSTPLVRLKRNLGDDETEEERVVEFDFFGEAGWDTAKLQAWVEQNAHPALAEVGAHNFRLYEQRGLPFVWVFLDHDGTDEQANAQKSVAKTMAKQQMGAMSFVWLKGAEYKDHWEQLGVTSVPGIAITTKENKKYVYTGKVDSVDELRAFVDDFHAGKLTAFLKSEPVPESNDGPVKVLVANNFDELVYNSGNDVFIEFYAPWCGHCKQLAPVWEKLGVALKDVKGLTIAKMDATANDASPLIEGFPTIYFHKAGDKEMVPEKVYNGPRSFKAFVSYLKRESSAELPSDLGREVDHKKVREFLAALDAANGDQTKTLEALKLYTGYVPKDLSTIVEEHEMSVTTGGGAGGDEEGGEDMENGDEDDGDAFTDMEDAMPNEDGGLNTPPVDKDEL